MTQGRGHNSTKNSDLGLPFNVEFRPVVAIQREILTHLHIFSWIATQEGVKIQQRAQNSTGNDGYNFKKNPMNIAPELVFNDRHVR